MKEIKTTADIANATAIDLGPLKEIKDYVLELGPDIKIPGKVFGAPSAISKIIVVIAVIILIAVIPMIIVIAVNVIIVVIVVIPIILSHAFSIKAHC